MKIGCPTCGSKKFISALVDENSGTATCQSCGSIFELIARDDAIGTNFRPGKVLRECRLHEIDPINPKTFSFNTFQKYVENFAMYPDKDKGYIQYPALGLSGEVGELVEKLLGLIQLQIATASVSEMGKKALRDNGGPATKEQKKRIVDEGGDVMWYLARLFHELGVPLGEVAERNIEKLSDRARRDVLHGSGDER